MIDFAASFTQVPALAPQCDISIYTGRRLAADLKQAIFRAPVNMQPVPRPVKTAVLAPAPLAALAEPPAPTGQLISVGAYLGYESRPRPEADEAVQS